MMAFVPALDLDRRPSGGGVTLLYRPIPILCPRCEVLVAEILPPAVSCATMDRASLDIADHAEVYHGGRPESLDLLQNVKAQCGVKAA